MMLLDEMIVAQAAGTPGAVAVSDASGTLTYAELLAAADGVAGWLHGQGVRPDDRVAVIVDRSLDLAVTVLGVLRAGAAFVPVETGTPPARVEAVLAAARVTVRLTARPPAAGRTSPLPRHPDQLCAVYFTSGSTGTPKAVGCTHTGWVNRIRWMQWRHGLQPGEAVLHKSTLTFDDAAVELLWPLTVGGRVAMLAPGEHRDPRAIIAGAIASDTVHLQFVPSMLAEFLTELTDADLAAMPRLRSVLCSGEALRPALVARFRERFGDRVSLDNTWGATEVSIDSTYRICDATDAAEPDLVVCVGTPMAGNTVHVLDEALRPVPDGEPGELCIGGLGLARGYLGDPRRTAAAFVPDPAADAGPGARMYRTGDRGRRRPDGGVMFLGRVDDQVKIRGVRIELGEVEVALRAAAGVRAAAVIAVETDAGKQLAAFVTGDRPGADLEPGKIRAHLRDVLPSYAVPTYLIVLDALPLQPSGKVDRQALATLDRQAGAEPADDLVPPRTDAEEAVAEIWCDVLGVEQVGVTQNFFAAGGHSLLAVRVLGRVRSAFALDVPLKELYDNPTVAALAARLEELVAAEVAAQEV
jgi:amino acid adenylation domain-containing protein